MTRYYSFLGLLVFLFLSRGYSLGKEVHPWAPIDPDCFFLDLSDSWKGNNGKTYSIPILPEDGLRKLSLVKDFSLPDSLPENLVLWVGRYAWEMEIVLNDHFLSIGRNPFHEFFLPLEKEWLQEGQNQIRIKLIYVEDFPHCPMPMLGIWDGIGLIEADRKENFEVPELPILASGQDTIALLAPYYGSHAYNFDEEAAAHLLLPLLKNRIEKVHFWFEPDRNFLAMCQRVGLKRVRSLEENQPVCAINYYPFQPVAHGKPYRFWLDSLGRRTSYYGEVENWNTHRKKEIPHENHLWFAFFAFLPFLSLALIKLANPSFFASMAGPWMGGSGRNEGSGENLYSSNALNLMLNFLRVLSHAACLALGLFFLQHLNLWNLTNQFFSDESLFALVFKGKDTLSGLYLKMLSILGIWQGLKWIALWMLGRVFGVKQMPGKGFSFEVFSDFPLVFFLAIPWIIGVYSVHDGGREVVTAMLVLFGLFILRKLVLMYTEISKTFNFSSAMKVLYICTLNVLPYLIWL